MSKRIITINRMYGSGGRAIGKALAEELGIGFYDKELIEIAAKDKNIPFSNLADVDEKRPGAWSFPVNHEIQISQDYRAIPMNDILFELQRDIILSGQGRLRDRRKMCQPYPPGPYLKRIHLRTV